MNSTLRLASRLTSKITTLGTDLIKHFTMMLKDLLVKTGKDCFDFVYAYAETMFTTVCSQLSSAAVYVEYTAHIFRLFVSGLDVLTAISKPFLILNPLTMFTIAYGSEFYKRLVVFLTNVYDLCKALFPHVPPPPIVAPPTLVPPVNGTAPTLPATAQSGESSLFANLLLSYFLPAPLKNVFKDFSLFSNFKILEDCSTLFDFVGLFFSIPKAIISYFDPTDSMKLSSFISRFEVYLPLGTFGGIKYRIENLIAKYDKQNSLVGDVAFQDQFLDAATKYVQFVEKTWDNKIDYPRFLQTSLKRVKSLKDKIEYMRNNRRVEPCFFVFYGPPGTGKTTLMNDLVASYTDAGMSAYVHVSHSDSKNFHDQYDNEDIYVVDDVGQKGVYQWADFINMVSTTKFPLECAAVDKKDTKFFTSRIIFATTNQLELTITPSCGITELAALHRRIRQLDFSEAKFIDGQWSGKIHYKIYDLDKKVFEIRNTFDCANNQGETLIGTVDTWIRTACARNSHNAQAAQAVTKLRAIPQDNPFLTTIQVATAYCTFAYTQFSTFLDNISDFLNPFDNLFVFSILTLVLLLPASAIYMSLRAVYSVYNIATTSKTPVSDLLYKQLPNEILHPICEQERRAPGSTSYLYNIPHIIDGQKLNGKSLKDHPYSQQDIALMTRTSWCDYFKTRPPQPEPSTVLHKPYKSDRKRPLSYVATPQSLTDVFLIPPSANFSSLTRIASQTFGVECIYNAAQGQTQSSFCSVFSGRFFTAPYHGVLSVDDNEIYVNVYRSRFNRVYDHVKVRKVFSNKEDDIVILELPSNLPTYSRNINFALDSQSDDMVLITPNHQHLVGKVRSSDLAVQYAKIGFSNVIPISEALLYDFNVQSLCGAFITTKDGFPIGHHVAYSQTIDKGIVKIFSPDTREALKRFFNTKIDFYVPLSETEIVGSRALLSFEKTSYPNTHNTIVPSQAFGIYPDERQPAQFGDKPIKTLKNLSSLAAENSCTADITALKFSNHYISSLLEPLQLIALSEKEVVTGGSLLNPIDKHTSVGYGLPGSKEDYIDFDLGEFRPHFRTMVADVEQQILDGIYPDLWFAEQFKQELRDKEKIHKPRIFKMSPLIHLVLIRKYFGHLLHYSHNSRRTTGIMVGINPFSGDWEDFAHSLLKIGPNMFGIDFEKWDKRMLHMFQQSLNDALQSRFKYSHPNESKIAWFLLGTISMTPSIVADETYISTHSLASGGGLTAEYNSWIHKMYMAYAFFNIFSKHFQRPPTLYDYITHVFNATYGDDGLNSVSDTLKDIFNGPSVIAEMAKIGLAATNEKKTDEWESPTKPLHECSFLKRTFAFHPKIAQLVAPLDEKSMCSTLNYVKDDFRNEELTIVKLQNFQREAFLHASDYQAYLNHLLQYTKEKGIAFIPLSEDYLTQLYEQGDFVKLLDKI